MKKIWTISGRKFLFGFPVFVSLLFGPMIAIAQFHEVGFGLGASTYSGDLVRDYNFLDNRPAGSIFYRQNYSEIVSVRYGLMIGRLQASDLVRPADPFAAVRGHSFNILVQEFSVVGEYHFLDYKHEKSLLKWSPYLFGGGAAFVISSREPSDNTFSRTQLAMPFGFGFKYQLSRRFTLGFETGARWTFTDWLDDLPPGDQLNKDFQYGNRFANDWYFFSAFSLSYTFYEIPCPYPYDPNKYKFNKGR